MPFGVISAYPLALYFLPNMEKFQHYFLSTLSPTLFSFCTSNNLSVESFVIVPHVPEAWFIFQSIFPLLFRFLSSVISTLLLNPSNDYFSLTVIFRSVISIWLFYCNLFLCFTFLLFHFLNSRTCNCLSNHFYDDCVKSLVR